MLAVHLFVKRDEKINLFIKRSQSLDLFPGMWGIPAGHVEPGETALEAVIREAREEVGIVLEPNWVHHITTAHQPDENYVHFFFKTYTWLGTPKNMEPDKCDELLWSEDIPNNIIPGIREVLAGTRSFHVFDFTRHNFGDR